MVPHLAVLLVAAVSIVTAFPGIDYCVNLRFGTAHIIVEHFLLHFICAASESEKKYRKCIIQTE